MFSSKQSDCGGGGENNDGNSPVMEHCLEPRKEQAEQLFLI